MKKVFALLIIVLFSSCTLISLTQLTESAVYVKGDMDDLKKEWDSHNYLKAVKVGAELPGKGSSGFTEITWKSSQSSVTFPQNRIALKHTVAWVKVRLTATITAPHYSEEADFYVTVIRESPEPTPY